MGSRGKIAGIENVPREIFYKTGHSRVDLGLPIGLKIHSNKYKRRFWPFFHVFGDFFANTSQSMRPRGKIIGIENVLRKILYNVGYFKETFL